jgi:CxxC motif-containing protein (DUF1111 family)
MRAVTSRGRKSPDTRFGLLRRWSRRANLFSYTLRCPVRANLLASRWCWAVAMIGVVVLTAEAKEPTVQENAPAKDIQSAATATPANPAARAKPESAPDGRELFTREWLPHDGRAHGGDGLGPVFNDSSCVACHNQGGVGGGGAASKNVDIITAFVIPVEQRTPQAPGTLPEALFNSLFGALAPSPASQPQPQGINARPQTADELKLAKKHEKEDLAKIHPGFVAARSVVLHHFGTDPKYPEWRSIALNGQFAGQQVEVDPFAEPPTAPKAAAAPVEPPVTADAPDVTTAPATIAPPAEVKIVTGTAIVATANVPSPVAVPTPAAAPPQDVVAPVPVTVTGTVTLTQAPGRFNITSGTAIDQPSATVPEIAQLQNEVRMNRGNLIGQTTQVTPSRFNRIQISRSQRNATALFGVGLIDAIPEKAIVELAKEEQQKYPEVAGRPSKQKDGRIGRFGWKAQKPTLEDFALTACAVELGLEVPGHEQAGLAMKPDYKAPGLDMDKAECDSLVRFLSDLPAPVERKAATKQEAASIAAGHKQFVAVGCANCHVQKVGPADGIYSDLLLHDMGPDLGDTGNYGIFIHDMPEEEQKDPRFIESDPNSPLQPSKPTAEQLAKLTGALRQEWRTPPLWGVRDSGPYLHDGRADTLEQAIAFHGGQSSAAAIKFFQLKPEQRQQVMAFLKSLTAPEPKLAMK